MGKFKHGMAKTRVYRSWDAMVQRCDNPNDTNYHRYGARGITYDPLWKDFRNFYHDMGDMPDGLTLDRIDNSKGYYKDNCKWSTYREQNNNRRSSKMLTYQGETLTRIQWERKLGLGRGTVRARLDLLGWSTEETLSTPSELGNNQSTRAIPPRNPLLATQEAVSVADLLCQFGKLESSE